MWPRRILTASIALTRSAAIALFGHTDPVNKTIRLDNLHDVKVSGVLADLPGNSSLTFDYIIPFSYYIQTQDWIGGVIRWVPYAAFGRTGVGRGAREAQNAWNARSAWNGGIIRDVRHVRNGRNTPGVVFLCRRQTARRSG